MDIFTLNIGQGCFVVVRSQSDAIIIDTKIPAYEDRDSVFVKGALSQILKGYYLRGLILTGFDRDHADADGVGLVVNRYHPDWVMYPKYYKDTREAREVFSIINDKKSMQKIPVRLDLVKQRIYQNLSNQMNFEVFSPHPEDMDNSNNCSLVVKIQSHEMTYLVTGDTENPRWESINRIFGTDLRSNIMAAPHHGSRGAANHYTLSLVSPHTVLISAGPGNQFDHPHQEALSIFNMYATEVHSTHNGISLHTYMNPWGRIVTDTVEFR